MANRTVVPFAGTDLSAPLPRLVIADGTLEALKWLGLVLMTLDHVNKFLFAQKLPLIFEAGRVVMPLFGFVLAYNLARPGAMASGAYVRMMKRLVVYGCLATPMFVLLVGWWPLNVLFTLLLSAGTIYLIERGGATKLTTAMLLFVVAGAVVEFWWFAVLYCVGAWGYCHRANVGRLTFWIAATSTLAVVNGTQWAMAALPMIALASLLRLDVPRCRRVFYLYYPAHLAALLMIQRIWV
jgi:hypothetical protein